MFLNASSFNQDIGNWNVSSAEGLVSIVMNTNATMYYELTHITHIYYYLFFLSLHSTVSHV